MKWGRGWGGGGSRRSTPPADTGAKRVYRTRTEASAERPMTAAPAPRPVVLCILDGWGHREICENNAICQAETPFLTQALKTRPQALIDASELEVGLPQGQFGNSEVGHMNLGAGRVVMQDLPRIDLALQRHEVATMPAFRSFVETMKASGGRVHLMGLLSPGGVHA